MSDDGTTEHFADRDQPESLRARDMAVSLTCDDLDESLVWYRDVVGFTVREEWKEDGEVLGVELIAGRASIYLGRDDGAKGTDRTKGQGMSIHLSTAQDIDALASRITERGGELASGPAEASWGARSFEIVDPNGFTFHISAEV